MNSINDKYTTEPGFGISMIKGTSMRPLIWGGKHCVAVVPLDEEPRIGDLLMFRYKDQNGEITLLHRLIEVKNQDSGALYITRGDNCLSCEYFNRDSIIGKVVEIHRLSGFRPWYIIPKKKFSVNEQAYLRYSRMWMKTWPIRRVIFKMRAITNSIINRLLSK